MAKVRRLDLLKNITNRQTQKRTKRYNKQTRELANKHTKKKFKKKKNPLFEIRPNWNRAFSSCITITFWHSLFWPNETKNENFKFENGEIEKQSGELKAK